MKDAMLYPSFNTTPSFPLNLREDERGYPTSLQLVERE
jgi:hypothetical protein